MEIKYHGTICVPMVKNEEEAITEYKHSVRRREAIT